MSKWKNNKEIKLLCEYLRIPSVHPNIDYEPCVTFLKKQAENLNLPVSVYYPVNKANPVVIITWLGSEPNLQSIMLNSHMDVVPVFEDKWDHPPFGAEIDEDGRIFARGAQDMKSIGMQYLAAIRALKQKGVEKFKRTIHVTFVPDEEINGFFGMGGFVESNEFKLLKIGFALDEGDPSPNNDFIVYYGERSSICLELKCVGQSGHGSLFVKNSPGKKVQHLINRFMSFRDSEEKRLENNAELEIGDVTTINLTMINGGIQYNVVPSEMSLTFDIRLAVDLQHFEFERQVKEWCEEAGGNIQIKILFEDLKTPITATDNSNPYWIAFKNATDELQLSIKKSICSGGTDSRFLRHKNIPAFGFSPIPNTPVTLHDHNEFIFADIYLEGIKTYEKIIEKVANV